MPSVYKYLPYITYFRTNTSKKEPSLQKYFFKMSVEI